MTTVDWRDRPVLTSRQPGLLWLDDYQLAVQTLSHVYGYTADEMRMSKRRADSLLSLDVDGFIASRLHLVGLPPIVIQPDIPDDKVLIVASEYAEHYPLAALLLDC